MISRLAAASGLTSFPIVGQSLKLSRYTETADHRLEEGGMM
jgi:hypothetical protein